MNVHESNIVDVTSVVVKKKKEIIITALQTEALLCTVVGCRKRPQSREDPHHNKILFKTDLHNKISDPFLFAGSISEKN